MIIYDAGMRQHIPPPPAYFGVLRYELWIPVWCLLLGKDMMGGVAKCIHL